MENYTNPIKLDYSLQDPQERKKLVDKIVVETPAEKLTPKYLEILANYLIFAMDKQERRERKVLTENRMITVNKRETSFQGLAETLQNGEDGIYGMIANDKNIIFTPKISITQKDIAEVPGLKELRNSIEEVEKQAMTATGKRKYALKKQAIEMRQQQYILKSSYHPPVFAYTSGVRSLTELDLSENISMDEHQEPHSDGIVTLFNPNHVSALLCNYARLKEECWSKFNSDCYYLMLDLEDLIDRRIKDREPYYFDLLVLKIDGLSNAEIQKQLYEKHGTKYSIEYISNLWRHKIPKLISEQAKEDYIVWYYTEKEYGQYKRCSKCGQIKLAHNRFFSKNNTSKDSFYSICKECRNKKRK